MFKTIVALSLVLGTSTSVAAMRWHKRVLLVCAPSATAAPLAAQRRILADWKQGAGARDLALVEIVGSEVRGASDAAAALRSRYGASARGFTVILIGKDGGVKLRRSQPMSAAVLEETIDAMPMRRAGER